MKVTAIKEERPMLLVVVAAAAAAAEASIAQGRTILNPEEVDFSLGYNDGTIDAQLDRFGATSIVTIDDTTINTSYVQGYIEGFYNTYLSIYGVAPW